jgi:hypothetical protein
VIVADALAEHYLAHGLPPDGGASDSTFRIRFGSASLRLPNPPGRRRAVLFHDVNHIVTGYNTAFSDGEMRIAGFEVGAGCGPFWIVWYINLSMFALGLLACPRGVFDAFVRGRRSASIYHRRDDQSTILSMSVAEVASVLRLEREPSASGTSDRFHFAAWAAAAVAVLVAPAIILIAVLVLVVRFVVQ